MSIKLKDTIFDYIDKANKDGSGNTISSTYLPKSGGDINGYIRAYNYRFINNSGTYLGLLSADSNDENTLYFATRSGIFHALIHSGNIGSYAWTSSNDGSGSGLDADLLDGIHESNFARFTELNTDYTNPNNIPLPYGDKNGFLSLHIPGSEYCGIIQWKDYNGNWGQIRHRYGNELYYRGTAATTWRHFAFIDSNVASATKLQTARSIWGQSFDGSGNIAYNQVPSFSFSYFIGTDGTTKVGYVGRGSSSSNAIYLSGYSGSSVTIAANNGNDHIHINTSGNVGIGTISPTSKLHVAGTIYASGAVSFGSTLSVGGLSTLSGGTRTAAVGKDGYIAYPDGGWYSGSGSVTGAIKITLPVYYSSTMMQMTVSIYNYNSGASSTYIVSGYNYAVDSNWYHTSAYSIRQGHAEKGNLPVRFGHDGSKCCIWIGETTTIWSYPKVSISNVTIGHSTASFGSWYTGWSVGIVTSLGTVQSTINNPATNYNAEKVGNSLSWGGYSSGSYDGSAAKSISIPSNTNQLTNGAGFITSNISGSINLNGDWETDFGVNFKEGGSDAYGFSLLYGASDLFKLVRRNESTATTVFSVTRGSDTVTFTNTPKTGSNNLYHKGIISEIKSDLGLGSAAYTASTAYATASHTHTFASITSKPTTLSGYGITDAYVPRKSYNTTSSPSGYFKININSTNGWMLGFRVRVYQHYVYHDIRFSGYNYGANYWYSPKAELISSDLSSITVYFGYDATNKLWVAIPANRYTGIEIADVVNGYNSHGYGNNYDGLFTITNMSSLSGTIQSTQTIYPPSKTDHTHSQYLTSSSYTASDVLSKIKTVDGSGSGLDSDTLDGRQAGKFVWNIQEEDFNPSDIVGNYVGMSTQTGITSSWTHIISLDWRSTGTTSISSNSANSSWETQLALPTQNRKGIYYRSFSSTAPHDWVRLIDSSNIGSQSVNYASSAGSATYATNSTYLYASDSPYRYGDSAPYYAKIRYNINSDNRWYLTIYPETPKTIAVDWAYGSDSVDGHHLATVTSLPSSPNSNTVYFVTG